MKLICVLLYISTFITCVLGQSQVVIEVEQCLQQFQAQLCDPSNLLTPAEQKEINSALQELKTVTSQPAEAGDRDPCQQGGIMLSILLLKDVQDPMATDQKINERINFWRREHPCDKTAVAMLSPGPDYRSAKEQAGDRSKLPYQYSYPVGVWSKFYGITNINVPVRPNELVQLYDIEKPLIRVGEYMKAILKLIHGVRDKAVGRKVASYTNANEQFQ